MTKMKAQEKVVQTLSVSDDIEEWATEFYRAKKVEGLSKRTQEIYKTNLARFVEYAHKQVITDIADITAGIIRSYMIYLEETGHNPGGVHIAYRVIKTFLRWYDTEAEPDGWRNPISKVKPPKVSEEPLDPVEMDTVKAMAAACEQTFVGRRNRAILLFLLDTGVRAREFLALDLSDVDLVDGSIMVRSGKGRKPRPVRMERKTRKAVREYLKLRTDNDQALWITDDGKKRLGYEGLRKALQLQADRAKVKAPTPHDFRRAFALNCLRNGMDLMTLARLMGHTTIKVLKRYVALTDDDLRTAHEKASPVDNSDL